jgi:hypothetical protein
MPKSLQKAGVFVLISCLLLDPAFAAVGRIAGTQHCAAPIPLFNQQAITPALLEVIPSLLRRSGWKHRQRQGVVALPARIQKPGVLSRLKDFIDSWEVVGIGQTASGPTAGLNLTIRRKPRILPVQYAEDQSPQASGTSLPPHWKPEWPAPTPEELAEAEQFLMVARHHLDSGLQITIFTFDIHLKRLIMPGRVLRAVYYRYPDIAGALVAGFGSGAHTQLAEILHPYGQSVLESDLAAALIDHAIVIFNQHVESTPTASHVRSFPKYKGKNFYVRFDLLGLAGVFGYLRQDAWGLQVFSKLDKKQLGPLIDMMMKIVSDHDHIDRVVLKQMWRTLETLTLEEVKLFKNSLSEHQFDDLKDRIEAAQEAVKKIPSGVQFQVFHFGGLNKTENTQDLRSELGNKGAQLVQMTQLGLPVPPGFTIPDAWTPGIREAGRFPDHLWEPFWNALTQLGDDIRKETGQSLRFGHLEFPFFLAVRSGAYLSSPGEFLTLDKIGLYGGNLEAYGEQIGNPYQARMDYLRHISRYADKVNHQDDDRALNRLFINNKFFSDYANGRYDALASIGSLDELDDLLDQAEELYKKKTGRPFFPSPPQQLVESIVAVARNYTEQTKGKGINVQWYVLGNRNDGQSFSGAAFSRNPFNGARDIVGVYRFASEGYNIVTPEGVKDTSEDVMRYADLAERMPQVYEELVRYTDQLEKHYGSIQDMEIVVSGGKLYFVQTRDNLEATTPLAKARILVDLATEGMMTEAEAIKEIELDDLEWLRFYFEQPVVKPLVQARALAKGVPLFPGIAQAPVNLDHPHRRVSPAEEGRAYIFRFPYVEASAVRDFDEILKRVDIRGMLVQQGNFADHVAVALRKSNRRIPYVTLSSLELDRDWEWARVGSQTFRSGDPITIDGNTGYIYGQLEAEDFEDSEVVKVQRGALPEGQSQLYPYYKTVLRWIELKKNNGDTESGGGTALPPSPGFMGRFTRHLGALFMVPAQLFSSMLQSWKYFFRHPPHISARLLQAA